MSQLYGCIRADVITVKLELCLEDLAEQDLLCIV